MSKTLELIFENAAGKSAKISVKDPKDDLDPEEVQNMMDLIVSKNIFTTSGGDIVASRSARVITKKVTEILPY